MGKPPSLLMTLKSIEECGGVLNRKVLEKYLYDLTYREKINSILNARKQKKLNRRRCSVVIVEQSFEESNRKINESS